MELYQASREAILRSRTLFSNIYRELNKESKNFSPGLIEEKSKTRDFATSKDDYADSGLMWYNAY